MSEGNERNLESVAPEAAENIQPNAAAEEVVEQTVEAAEAAAVTEAKERTSPAEGEDRENAPRKVEPKPKKKKKKRGKKNVVLPLVVVLLAVLVVFGVLVGYGLGRVRNGQRQEPEAVEETADAADEAEAPAYDAFTEELTQENQRALDLLSGADDGVDEGAEALLGESELLDELSEESEAPAAEAVVLAEYGDGQKLMSDEVLEVYDEELTMYILSGYSEEEIAETLLDDVLQTMVSDRVLAEHAREMGLYDLNDEDRAEIEAEAKASYEEYVEYAIENDIDAEGKTDEEARAAAQAYLEEFEGITYDGILEEIGSSWWEQKVFDAITASVTVSDAQVRESYEDLIEEQKESFTEYPEDYEFTQMNGETIVYNLPGYRAVKLLLLPFESDEDAIAVYGLTDELATMDEEGDTAHLAEQQAELDGYYAAPEARAAEALEQLRAGADMDELILTIGGDEGMKSDRLRAQGYYVSSDSMFWPEEFINAAMALENVGDYSEPVRIEDGVCILQYLGEVTEGEVPLADVREALAEETLDAARSEAYEEQLEAWLEEANPSYYPERMQ